MTLRVGTSGWSYPSGRGTWNGMFYPAGRSKRAGTAGFDELRYYAEHFDTVEVNSSFYGTPRPEVTRGWADRTPPGFEFSVKLYQKFTHPKMFRERALKAAPGSTGNLLDLLARVTQSDVDEVRAALDPLASAGKLGALLAQFPASFKASPQSRDYLTTLLRAFADYRVAVELRHKTWSDEFADTLSLLNAHHAAFVQIDEPKFRLSIKQNYLPNVTSFYYMRLHGRNAANWWRQKAAEDRYDYLYSEEELREFSDIAGAAQALVRKSYLYANNHFASKSVVNAVMLKAQLGQPIDGEYPGTLIENYPEIRGLVAAGARQAVGLRPFRPGGFRVEVEHLGRQVVVHNYGHGGCGVTLSWGTAAQAVDLACRDAPRRAAVLGAGAVGLATARLLQERGVNVTVYARELPPHTTSDVAGALWSPVTLVDEGRPDAAFARRLAEAARLSHQRFEALLGEEYGVRWVPFYLIGESAAPPVSWEWAATPEFFRPVTLGPGEHPFPSAFAHSYRLMLIEPAIYLAAIVRDVHAAGGRIVARDLSRAAVAALDEPVILNCTGLGSAELFGDSELVPIKGQLTILEPQPGVDYAVKSTMEDLYMFSRRDGVVLGGSHQRGVWTLTADPQETARILASQERLFAEMRQ